MTAHRFETFDNAYAGRTYCGRRRPRKQSGAPCVKCKEREAQWRRLDPEVLKRVRPRVADQLYPDTEWLAP